MRATLAINKFQQSINQRCKFLARTIIWQTANTDGRAASVKTSVVSFYWLLDFQAPPPFFLSVSCRRDRETSIR